MCSKKWTIIISFIIILVMGGIYTFLQLRLYTPEMKEFAKNIIPISNDIKEYFIRFFYRCGCNRRYCNF